MKLYFVFPVFCSDPQIPIKRDYGSLKFIRYMGAIRKNDRNIVASTNNVFSCCLANNVIKLALGKEQNKKLVTKQCRFYIDNYGIYRFDLRLKTFSDSTCKKNKKKDIEKKLFQSYFTRKNKKDHLSDIILMSNYPVKFPKVLQLRKKSLIESYIAIKKLLEVLISETGNPKKYILRTSAPLIITFSKGSFTNCEERNFRILQKIHFRKDAIREIETAEYSRKGNYHLVILIFLKCCELDTAEMQKNILAEYLKKFYTSLEYLKLLLRQTTFSIYETEIIKILFQTILVFNIQTLKSKKERTNLLESYCLCLKIFDNDIQFVLQLFREKKNYFNNKKDLELIYDSHQNFIKLDDVEKLSKTFDQTNQEAYSEKVQTIYYNISENIDKLTPVIAKIFELACK